MRTWTNHLARTARLLPLLLLIVTGCGGGGGAGGAPAFVPEPDPLSASVAQIVWPPIAQGLVPVSFNLVADEPLVVDLELEVSLDDGSTWFAAHVEDPNQLSGLSVGPNGATHVVRWDSLPDVGFRSFASAILRAKCVRGAEAGAATASFIPAIDNLRFAAERIENYMVHYGDYDAPTIQLAETYDLVVLHPHSAGLAVATIREIQDGIDPADPRDDVIVLAYISIGEDIRTIGVSDPELYLDARFIGDGTGPRIDPRGPDADGDALTGIDPLGLPSTGGTGLASWYLDDNTVDQNGVGDGIPDRNSIFGGLFVNAGDPAWFSVLDQMLFDSADGAPGLRELLTSDYGRGYACDGLKFDTTDTCAPNAYTNPSDVNQSEFEWTAPGFAACIQRMREAYPNKVLLQNRGVFFYDPRLPHYEYCTRPWLDILKFESYRLNSNSSQLFDPYFFPDNKHNFAPKTMAEAARADGFRMVSAGYAEGPANLIDKNTLLGTSTIGFDTLVEDIREAQDLAGFRHYLTTGSVSWPNDFVRQNSDVSDSMPPVWSSSWNDNESIYPTPPIAPTPRVGIQAVDAGPACAAVHWDVAMDLHPVSYALYHNTMPFDFVGDPNLQNATRVVLRAQRGLGYGPTIGAGIYANQDVVTGLQPGVTNYLCIRAFDTAGNEEKNEVTLSAVPRGLVTIAVDGAFADWQNVPLALTDPADVADSNGPDFQQVWLANDADSLYVRFTSENAFDLDGAPGPFSRTLIFIDVDGDPTTGYVVNAQMGSELLVFGNSLFRQSADTFNDGFVRTLSAEPQTGVRDLELSVPLSDLFAIAPDASRIRILLMNDEVSDTAPDTGALSFYFDPSCLPGN